jgi:hypothetical protein
MQYLLRYKKCRETHVIQREHSACLQEKRVVVRSSGGNLNEEAILIEQL